MAGTINSVPLLKAGQKSVDFPSHFWWRDVIKWSPKSKLNMELFKMCIFYPKTVLHRFAHFLEVTPRIPTNGMGKMSVFHDLDLWHPNYCHQLYISLTLTLHFCNYISWFLGCAIHTSLDGLLPSIRPCRVGKGGTLTHPTSATAGLEICRTGRYINWLKPVCSIPVVKFSRNGVEWRSATCVWRSTTWTYRSTT